MTLQWGFQERSESSLRSKVGTVSISVIIKLGLEPLSVGESGLCGDCRALLPCRLQVMKLLQKGAAVGSAEALALPW